MRLHIIKMGNHLGNFFCSTEYTLAALGLNLISLNVSKYNLDLLNKTTLKNTNYKFKDTMYNQYWTNGLYFGLCTCTSLFLITKLVIES